MNGHGRVLAAAATTLAIAVGPLLWGLQGGGLQGGGLQGGQEGGLQGGGDPKLFRPVEGRQGLEVEIDRGKFLLFLFLQRFADYTGKPTYFVGEEAPETTLTLSRAVRQLDARTAQKILADAGYRLSRQTYRDQAVYWVQRLIVNPNRKGGLIRREDGEEAVEPSAGAASASAAGVALFERRDGSGERFLVTFETESRKEADDAVLLLEAFQAKRIGAHSQR